MRDTSPLARKSLAYRTDCQARRAKRIKVSDTLILNSSGIKFDKREIIAKKPNTALSIEKKSATDSLL